MIFTTGVGSWFFIFPLAILLQGKLREIAQALFHLGGGFGKIFFHHFTAGEASGNCLNPISPRGKLRANDFLPFHHGGSFGVFIHR
ncbi:hypothetical protein BPO_2286 [Bergeyella porcorum]|uniref:Ammonium transporter AmtB-like domain-containing protein n=1 Tax=Bergeyella porcorum TaxID=1735111 RepID=A0AAU0FA59_9FLAO